MTGMGDVRQDDERETTTGAGSPAAGPERPAGMAPAQAFLFAITALAVGFAALMAFLMYWVVPALAS
jgi:hypothetical protein